MTEAEDYGDQPPSPSAGQDHLARRRRGWAVAACAAGLYAASMLMPAVAPFNPGFSSTTYPGTTPSGSGWPCCSNASRAT
jgi:hypothetical protein